MAFADAAKYNEVRRMRGLPIGTIVPWAAESSAIPTGWLVCNGRNNDIDEYPLLYEAIGNVYGGTAGSTFKVPALTNNQKGIVDISEGYFTVLQGKGDAHKPQYSSKSDDEFWKLVGGGNNGNEAANTQSTWQSTIDLVGEFSGSPDFLATYDDITITEGSYFGISIYNSYNLMDYHMSMHSHGIANESSTETTSYNHDSPGQAVRCPSGGWPVGSCKMVCTQTPCLRVRNGLQYANNSGHLNESFSKWSSPAAGGGSVQPVPGGETASGGYYPGDGRCAGNMTCASYSGNDKITFTSLSSDEKVDSQPHNHTSSQFDFEADFSVTSPGIVNNVKINTVKIVNSSGENFGNITATTVTPTLDMVFIIRAY
jgi:microcystin-dependent protein